MSDFPSARASQADAEAAGVISTAGPECAAGATCMASSVQFATAGAWPANNQAQFYSVLIPSPCTVTQMAVEVTTQSGNVDVGIYDEALNLKVSAGSTATAAAGVQVFNITDTPLTPGTYYLAMACSTTAAAFRRASMNAVGVRCGGVGQQATAMALPNPATMASTPNSAGPFWISASLLSATM